MNKKGMLFLTLVLSLSIVWSTEAYADYNLTCERSCAVTVETDCYSTNPSALEYYVNVSGNLTLYNLTYRFYNESNGLLSTSTRTTFLDTPDFTSSDLVLEPDQCYFTSSNLREIINGEEFNTTNVYNNWTFRLLNGSSLDYADWVCINESVRITNDDAQANYDIYDTVINCERGEIVDVVIQQYSSTDGTCSGTLLQATTEYCDGTSETQINYPSVVNDIRYRILEYDYVNEPECILTFLNHTGGGFDDEFTPYGTGTNGGYLRYIEGGTNYSCPVDCDGTSYALNLVREVSAITGESLGYASAVAERYDFVFKEMYTNWTECDGYNSYCSLWGTPTNESLTYGCDCPPDEFDFGLYCSGDSCYKTCDGTTPDYYNETIALAGTLEGALTSGDAVEVSDYFVDKIGGVFGEVGFLIDEYFFELVAIGLVIIIFIIGIGFILGSA